MEKEVGNESLAVSALSEALASSVPPIYIQVVFECEDLIDKQRCFQALTKAMQVIPCFSSIMTVNDVICGIIFYAFQSYLHICQIADFNNLSLEEAYKARNAYDLTSLLDGTNPRVTGLTLINMRVLSGLQSLKEMLNPETLAPWGNYFSVLQIPLPVGKLKCPIESIRLANLMIDRQKKSAGLLLNCKIMDLLLKILGPSRVAKCLYNAFATTSLSISHVVGPMEEVCLAGHAIKSFNFFLSGTPQALHLHVVSYMDKLVVDVTGHKPYVNAQLFSTCLENSFTLAREICGNTG